MDPIFSGFWLQLERPLVALSPMDGVTDMACRKMVAQYGRPDVMFTEFTSAEGLFHNVERLLWDFDYSEIERPIVAQLYGHRPDDFYRATLLVCELGFDGVDINMGCPAKSVVHKNCGAKLITLPTLAREIMRATVQACIDWSEGLQLSDAGITQEIIDAVGRRNEKRSGRTRDSMRRRIPYSVKTRIGYDSVSIETWVETLLQEKPAVISIHGRTLQQRYRGTADWEAIARAVCVAQGEETLIIGNGDITTMEDAARRILESGVDGVLIGRASLGNPWIFSDKDRMKEAVRRRQPDSLVSHQVARQERFRVAVEHARTYHAWRGDQGFHSVRKHLGGYLRHFHDAAQLRHRAMQTTSPRELEALLNAYPA